MAFPFYGAGVLFKKLNYQRSGRLVNLILIIAWGTSAVFNGYADIHIQMNGRNYLLFLFTGIVGTYLCVVLASAISKVPLGSFFKRLGIDSMIILITHYYICRGIVPAVLDKINVQSNIFIQIALTIVIVILYYFGIGVWDTIKEKLSNHVRN